MRKAGPWLAVPRLGELELKVLELLWSTGPSDVRSVHAAVGKPRGTTVNTVHSALKRLCTKGLLTRTKVSHAHVYRSTVDRETFLHRKLAQVFRQLSTDEANRMLGAFVDLVAQADPSCLQRLEQLVIARRACKLGSRSNSIT